MREGRPSGLLSTLPKYFGATLLAVLDLGNSPLMGAPIPNTYKNDIAILIFFCYPKSIIRSVVFNNK
jgi:hypothetical protein